MRTKRAARRAGVGASAHRQTELGELLVRRGLRTGVEDLWRKRVKDRDGNLVESPSARDGRGLRWRARYVDDAGREYTRAFGRKVDAQKWINSVTASLVRGDHVAPKAARTTVSEWCDTWLDGYRTRRRSTVRQAEVHIKIIKERFGPVPLSAVKPSDVKGWTAKLKADGRAESYVYALHARLSHLFSDAVHDGIVPRNPCSRRTSPGAGSQTPYVATTAQVCALHDAVPVGIRPAILLGAHAGLRLAEAAALCGLDVKTVQARLRHASAKTTLDIYGHLWPDTDESSRAAVAAVYAERRDSNAHLFGI